jgi:hypothetical protein
MVWMDIVGCGDSDTPAREGYFEIKSPPWKSKIGGVMLATAGHVHDGKSLYYTTDSHLTLLGGAYTTLYVNNRPICVSKQLYGTKTAYIEKGNVTNLNDDNAHGHGHSMPASEDSRKLHISEASGCVNFGVLNVGDVIQVGATYNTTAHSLNVNAHTHGMSLMKSAQEFFNGVPKYA